MTTTTQIHVWWSAGGGVGKTTMAIMQAAALARQFPGQVALADFKEAMPHIHRYLGLEPKNLMPLFDASERGCIGAFLLQSLMQTKYGISILTGIALKEFTNFAQKYFVAILQTLRNDYKYIVVDLNDGVFFSATAAALSQASCINVVCLPRMNCLQDTIDMTDFLRRHWGLPTERFTYFLNRANGLASDLTPAEFDTLLGAKTIKIPETKEIAAIAAGGNPLVPEATFLLPADLVGSTTTSKRGLKLFSLGRNAYVSKPL